MPFLYPPGAFPDYQSSGAAAGAMNPGLVAAPTGSNLYICGFGITGSGATAASIIQPSLSQIWNRNAGVGQTVNFQLVIPAGVTTSITPLIVEFTYPLLVAPGQACTLNVPSFGAGNTNAGAYIHGFVY